MSITAVQRSRRHRPSRAGAGFHDPPPAHHGDVMGDLADDGAAVGDETGRDTGAGLESSATFVSSASGVTGSSTVDSGGGVLVKAPA
ncbi:hypothetical protein [Amycolatopsis sp. NPDC051372]|uniref:hypothetical protein n=1 Tax=unclassified Amycolatopsis TaxID=2618356 RepID=UPI00341C7E0E